MPTTNYKDMAETMRAAMADSGCICGPLTESADGWIFECSVPAVTIGRGRKARTIAAHVERRLMTPDGTLFVTNLSRPAVAK